MILKALSRLKRILIGKKGIYGTIGKNNRFTRGVYILEFATIGNNNYFGFHSMIGNATIGNYCSIGPGVKIGQANHSKNYITTYQELSSKLINHSLFERPAIIGNDVWCGANVVILQGVKVGDGAIIGANAVVTKDIPDYAIATGVPAKVNKFRFDKDTVESIKNSEWFLHDFDKAQTIIESLHKKIKL